MSSRYDSEGWTHEEFLEKMDHEGGVLGLLDWGGPGCFPPEIRGIAERIYPELMEMLQVIAGWDV